MGKRVQRRFADMMGGFLYNRKCATKFDPAGFSSRVTHVYREVSTFAETGRRTREDLEQLCTEPMAAKVKKQAEAVKASRNQVEFSIGTVSHPESLSLRTFNVKQAGDLTFTQAIVRLRSSQVKLVKDHRDRVLQGSSTPKDVEEVLMFERFLDDKNADWRLAAVLRSKETERPKEK